MKEKAKKFALRDIARGCMKTLWVNRLEEEHPELYKKAMKKRQAEKGLDLKKRRI